MTEPAVRSTLADWLALHDWSAEDVHAILDRADPAPPRKPAREPAPDPRTAEAIWALAATALARALPDQSAAIERIATTTRRQFPADPAPGRPAFTLIDPRDGQVLVWCPYRGRAGDALLVAHEFGHAVQIAASEGRSPAPVARELCARLAEIALFRHLTETGDALAPELSGLLQRGAGAGRAAALRAALDTPATPYAYAWNYPVAQSLAGLIDDPAILWPLFTGQTTAATVWRQVRG